MCRNVAIGIIIVIFISIATSFAAVGLYSLSTDNCKGYRLTNLYTGDSYECDTFYLYPEATIITSEMDTFVCDSVLMEKLKCL